LWGRESIQPIEVDHIDTEVSIDGPDNWAARLFEVLAVKTGVLNQGGCLTGNRDGGALLVS
jgi:hypothetical protein